MINMDNLKKINDLCRTKVRTWCLCRIDAAVAARAYYCTTSKHPRDLRSIIESLNSKLMARDDVQIIDIKDPIYYFENTVDGITDIVIETLMLDKKFREWNLTDYELEQGVDVDRPDTQYFDIFEKSDKKFIDLDGFKRNLRCDFRSDIIEDIFFKLPHYEDTSV